MNLRNILKILISTCLACLVLGNGTGQKVQREDVKIEVLVPGRDCSRKSGPGTLMRCHYIGKLTTGKEFENSYTTGKPVLFILGTGQVLKGWERGLKDMCVGEKRRLTIPPHLGYGSKENGEIPAKSTLIYDIEAVDVRSEDDLGGVFPKLDVNHDGVLDMNEVKNHLADSEALKQHLPFEIDESMKFYLIQTMFQLADKNRDGGLSEEEFKGLTQLGSKMLKKKEEL